MLRQLTFTPEKKTKNTVKFQEVPNGNDNPSVGSIYIQKTALKTMKWQENSDITVTIET